MNLPFSSLATWAQILNHPGVAQDVMISLLLPFVNATYGSVAWLLVIGLFFGLIYVGWRMLYEGSGRGVAGYFAALIVAILCLFPVHVTDSNSLLFHAGTFGPNAGWQPPNAAANYTVPAGFYYLVGATNAVEEYLYAVIDEGNIKLAEGGVAYNGMPLDAYTVLDENYAADLNDPYLVGLYNSYQSSCRYVMMDKGVSDKYNVLPYQWYGVGFMSAGVLGTIGTNASFGHKLLVTATSILPNFLNSNPTAGAVGATESFFDAENINTNNAMLALANADPSSTVSAVNQPFQNIQIKGDAYWQAVYATTALPSNPYVEVPTSYWVEVADPTSGALLGAPTKTQQTNANTGLPQYLYSATNCLQMMNLVNVAFRYMRDGLNLQYNVATGCFDGGACNGQVANANLADASTAQLMASEAFMNDISKAETPNSNGNVPYQYNGIPTNGQGEYAARIALNWKSQFSQLGIWVSKYFKIPIICVAAVSLLAVLVGLMMVIAPFIIALSILPGRFSMLMTFFKMLIFMKCTVWLMYLIFVVGGYVSSVLLAGTVNGGIGNLSGAASIAATALSSQSLVVVGVLYGAPKMAYMLVFNRSHYLQQGVGAGAVQEMDAQGQAVINAAVEAAATALWLVK